MTFQRCAIFCVAIAVVLSLPCFATIAEAGSPTADRGEMESGCTAFARCWDGSRISCSGTSNCSAQDRACPSINGWVSCDGSTIYCGPCKGIDSDCPEAGRQCVTDADCVSPPTQLGCPDCECVGSLCACPYI